MTRRPPGAPLVIVVEPVRVPGDMVVCPWQCVVRCPGKGEEKTPRRWTRRGAIAAAGRIGRHLASGRPYVLEVQ